VSRAFDQRRGKRGRPRSRLCLIAALLVTLATAALAHAELTQKGNLFVRFDGGIAPKALPRHGLAPIAVRIEGTVRVPAGKEPPALNRIRVALNRAGRLDVRGLPVCRRGELVSSSAKQALDRCGPALVGSGGIVAMTSFAGQPHELRRGDLLLFNSVEGSHPAILAQLSLSGPTTSLIGFAIRRTAGTYGTLITATLPPTLQHNGYLKSIFLRFQRRFTYRGRQRSYLSASCSAPPGFSAAVFPFARASMSFDDGRTLSATLSRTCHVSR
jgi:hypothetical protein